MRGHFDGQNGPSCVSDYSLYSLLGSETQKCEIRSTRYALMVDDRHLVSVPDVGIPASLCVMGIPISEQSKV